MSLPGLAVNHLQTDRTPNQLLLHVVGLVVMFQTIRNSAEPLVTGLLHLTLELVRLLLVRLQLGQRRENLSTLRTPPVLVSLQQTQAGQ